MADLHLETVAVCVCTYRRPEMLRSLIDALRGVIDASADRCSVQLVAIVDDSPEGSAESVVDGIRATYPVKLLYVHQGSQNLSIARNRALEVGLSHADFVAFIDDDCHPEADWLIRLLETQQRFGADIVSSGVNYRAPEGAPAWLAEQGFLDAGARYDDGVVPTYGITANSLFRSAWFRAHPEVRFITDFGRTGGEDVTFFVAAKRAGAHLRWARRAMVSEDLTAARSTMRHHLGKGFWYGNNQVVINLHTRETRRFRLFLQAANRIRSIVGSVALALLRRRPVEWRWKATLMMQALGMLAGLVGIKMRHF